ncbi:MAG: PIG-L family deacetylase, partial [Calditrichaeota bacterium]
MKSYLLLLIGLFYAVSMQAQPTFSVAHDSLYLTPRDERGLLGLHQSLLDASTGFTLMSVAAHPDDEDIFSITYFRRKYGIHTVVVVSNRGEGGQIEIGPELYTDLAVVRSHEMAAAERISGSEYYNLNFVDFGYSKDIQETFDKWGKEKLLEKMVYMIRRLRPQVIITNHDSVSGHSNHQAVGWAIRHAFKLAGDPAAFRQQLKNGLMPWQPLRLFQRISTRDTKSRADVVYNVGEFSPLWGMSYAQLAARALAQHRSQGFDKFARTLRPGPRNVRYKLVLQANPQLALKSNRHLFAGLNDPLETIL